MTTIRMEWRHYDKEGTTCDRCGDTGVNLKRVISEYARQGVMIELRETLLDTSRINESNQVLINGVPLEKLLAGASVGESDCPSCSCLVGEETRCRTITCESHVYEEITPELIRRALDQVVGER